MARVLVTGSTQGIGRRTAEDLLAQGHDVVVHARNAQRALDLDDLVGRGAQLVVGDLARSNEVRDLAEAINRLGPMDAVVHNAAVSAGVDLLPVNVVAPYLLTALVRRPRRLVYLSSGMHRGGRTGLDRVDWSGRRDTRSYSDSKLLVTVLAFALARLWPDVATNAVDPGWVPTRMGGAGAPDDLGLGSATQAWLAAGTDPEALTTGGYWHHQKPREPHPAVQDRAFQDELVHSLVGHTGVTLQPCG